TVVRSATPELGSDSLLRLLESAFHGWDNNSHTVLDEVEEDTGELWAPVDFNMVGYIRKNPSYKLFQILWSISSQINNHSTGCHVTVEPQDYKQKCCKFEYVHTLTGFVAQFSNHDCE
ncbi:hypothetical protein P879_11928, partial [Paragonimus westermani]